MGDFIFKLHAMGGHGCERTAKAGEVFTACGRIDCPDCFLAMFVEQYKARFPGSMSVLSATLTHWPAELAKIGRSYDEAHEVVDDLAYVTKDGWFSPRQRKRIKGSFGG